jgi:hypothetical protein
MSRLPTRALLAGLLAISWTGSAAAGASSAPFAYQPDPALQTASRSEIESRFRRTCGSTQARLQGTSTQSVTRGCACYASRTLRALDAAELAAYRGTGTFNESARAKALTAIDQCRLKRPV